MPTQAHSMTGGSELELAYVCVVFCIMVGLHKEGANLQKYLVSPLLALPLMLVIGVVIQLTSPLLRIFGIGQDSFLQTLYGSSVTCVMAYATGRFWPRYRNRSSEPEHRRGAVVGETQAGGPGSVFGRKSDPAAGRGSGITLAGIPIALEDETKHFKFIGTTGTGKSTAFRELLTGALARGDSAIIADPDGGYLSRFYDPARGDVILNPFDGNARKWDLFGEVTHAYDVEQLARSLIPDSGDSERIWSEYARTFFTAVARQMMKTGQRDDRELHRLIKAAPREELRLMLQGTAAGPFLEEGNEKMCGSIRSVATSAVRALEYTTQQQAEPFSVKQWIQQNAAARRAGKPGAGVLFIPYTAGQIAALRSVISAWLRLAIFEAMDCGEGDQFLWFLIDEVDALGEIDGLKDALARLRKFGGRCGLGLQSIAQMSGTYGKPVASTIVENCGNTVVFRCSASEQGGTSEFASKLIGQREVLHTTVSKSRRATQVFASTTTSQQLRIEPAVMASEIERLPDLAAFLKLASISDWQRVTFTRGDEPVVTRPWRPVVVTPSASSPPPEASTSGPSATVAPSTPSVRRSKQASGQRRAGAAKRTRQPQSPSPQSSAPQGEEAREPPAPPPAAVPDSAANGVVQSRAGGAESNFQTP
jgi:type IV secretory pathway TraG/TraD family ATPase VirD4